MTVALDDTLNKEQLECVNNLEGKYLVLAGPGTGKTHTVIRRLQAMINKGINPERILCLTYSVAGATEMKKRVIENLDEDCSVEIYTFHSFCNKIIQENFEEFSLSENFDVIPETIEIALLKECIDEIKDVKYYISKKADPYSILDSIKKGIGQLKHYRITDRKILEKNIMSDSQWQKAIDALEFERDNKPSKRKNYEKDILEIKEKIEKVYELYRFFELYKKKMELSNYIDYDDMINFILEKFEQSQTFTKEIASKYDYIIVDEYQDTNKSQNELIFHLVDNSKNGNIFVVGDDEQIVNAAQGARLDSIEAFLKKYPEIKKPIIFKENWRSTQTILDVARIIADNNPLHLPIERYLSAKNPKIITKDKKVRFNIYSSYDEQYGDIVNEIDNLINSLDCPTDNDNNKDYSKIAILATNHNELEVIAQLLKNRNIPAQLKNGKSIFEIKSVIVLLYYIQTLSNPELYGDKLFKLLLMPPFNIDPKTYMKLYERTSIDKTFIETMQNINEKSFELIRFLDTYNDLKNSILQGETVKNIVLQAAARSGITDFFFNFETNRLENIQGLKRFFEEVDNFSKQYKKVTLEEFIEYLDMALNDNVAIRIEQETGMNAIQLTTYQSSKGLEYEYVYMPSLQKSKWESNSQPIIKPSIPLYKEDEKEPDEWKTFKTADKINKLYVGMTRAKHTLRLSYVDESGSSGYSSLLRLDKIPKDLIEINTIENKNKNTEKIYNWVKFWAVKEYDYKRDFKNRTDSILKDCYFSPSFINDYIKCPRLFFYNQILKIGSLYETSNALSFGSAIHYACEALTKYALENKKYYDTPHPFVEAFKKKLEKLPVSGGAKTREHLLQKGEKMLNEYFKHFIQTPTENIYASEKTIIADFEGVKFKGKIDRIDIKDGKFIIYDYKTGVPKKEEEIAFDTKYENYYMQMGLYKYFLELSDEKKRTVERTDFIFLENYKTPCSIKYDKNATDEVIEKYKNAINGIKEHNFNPKPSDRACEYCPYKGDICPLFKD